VAIEFLIVVSTHLNSALSVDDGSGREPSLACASSNFLPSCRSRVESPPSSTICSGPWPDGHVSAFSVHHQYSSRVSPFHAKTEEVVALAKPGMYYKLKYQLGGGGGHTIMVKNWTCSIYPPACFASEPTSTFVVDRVGEAHREFDRNPKVGPDGHRIK